MSWKVAESLRCTGGKTPDIICDGGGWGKEPVCILVGEEPVGIAEDLCRIARTYAEREK